MNKDDDDDVGLPGLEDADDDEEDLNEKDDEDPFKALSEEEEEQLTDNTEAVHDVITKVCTVTSKIESMFGTFRLFAQYLRDECRYKKGISWQLEAFDQGHHSKK